jgi:hypothetical protein
MKILLALMLTLSFIIIAVPARPDSRALCEAKCGVHRAACTTSCLASGSGEFCTTTCSDILDSCLGNCPVNKPGCATFCSGLSEFCENQCLSLQLSAGAAECQGACWMTFDSCRKACPECTLDTDCGRLNKCRNHKCIRGCEANTDCKQGEWCWQGVCVSNVR